MLRIESMLKSPPTVRQQTSLFPPFAVSPGSTKTNRKHRGRERRLQPSMPDVIGEQNTREASCASMISEIVSRRLQNPVLTSCIAQMWTQCPIRLTQIYIGEQL